MTPAEKQAIRARLEARLIHDWDGPSRKDFIAHAPQDIAALLAEVERLDKELGYAIRYGKETKSDRDTLKTALRELVEAIQKPYDPTDYEETQVYKWELQTATETAAKLTES